MRSEIAVAHGLGTLAQGGSGDSVVEVSNELSSCCQLTIAQVVRRIIEHRPLDEAQQVVSVGGAAQPAGCTTEANRLEMGQQSRDEGGPAVGGRVNDIANPKDSARHRNFAGIDFIH